MERRGKVLKFIYLLLNRTTLIVIAFAATLVIVIGGRFELASAAQPNAELEIQKLTVCYALGINAIGRGNLQEGKNIWRDCFTRDAEFTIKNPVAGVVAQRTGSDAWADYAYSYFQGKGYTATQHLMGSINVLVLNANQATMSSYLYATQKLSETSVDVNNGTYEDEVVKEYRRWKIRRRTLNGIVALNLKSTTDSTGANQQ